MDSFNLIPEECLVLVVDDVQLNCQLIGDILETENYQVIFAANGQEALEKVYQTKPDLILLDLMMPDIDGIEVANQLKIQPQYQDIPIIFLTVYVREDYLLSAFKAGAVDYIYKPVKRRELIARVRTHLKLKKQTEQLEKNNQKLRENEKKLMQILDAVPIGISVTESSGNLVYLNKTGQDLSVQILSQNTSFCTIDSLREINLSTINQFNPENQISDFLSVKDQKAKIEDLEFYHKNGQLISLEVHSIPIFNDQNHLTYKITTFSDITERKKAEKIVTNYNQTLETQVAERTEALQLSEARFRSIFESSAIGIALNSLEGQFLMSNFAYHNLLGYSQLELSALSWQAITHPSDLEQDLTQIQELLKGNIPYYHLEKRFIHKKGHIVWTLLAVSLVRDSQNTPLYLIKQIQDITARKQTEEQLQRELYRSHLLQHITNEIRSQLDPNTLFQTAALQIGQAFQVCRALIHTYSCNLFPNAPVVGQYLAPGFHQPIMGEIPWLGNPQIEKLLSEDRALAFANVKTEPLFAEFQAILTRNQLKSLLAVRTSYLGEVNGLIMLHQCNHYRDWTVEEINLLEVIAAQLGIAVAQIQLLDQEKQARAELNCHNVKLQQEIEERQRVEMELRRSETTNRALLEAIPDLMFRCRADGTYIDFKPAKSMKPWVSPEEFLGKKPEEVLPPEIAPMIHQAKLDVLSSGQIKTLEYQLFIDHHLRDFEARIIPCGTDETMTIVREITERKQAEEELRRRETMLNEAQQLAKMGSWFWNLEKQEIWWSQGLYQMVGREPNTPLNQIESIYDFVHPADQQQVQEMMHRAIEQGIPYEVEFQGITPAGPRFFVSQGQLEYNSQGGVKIFKGFAQDITERKASEEALQASEQFLRSIYEGIEAAIFIIDVTETGTFRYVGVNPNHEHIFGVPASYWVGKTPEEALPLDVAQAVLTNYQRCLSAGDRISYEEKWILCDQETWWITNLTPLKDYNGRIYRLIGTSFNITERRKAEETLREREVQLSAIITHTSDGILILNAQGEVCFANPAAANLFENTMENLIGFQWGIPLTEAAELSLLDSRGVHPIVEIKVAPTEWKMEPAYLISLRDITTRKQVEMALERAKDAAEAANHSKSIFLANMSHELRSPLNAILGFAHLLYRTPNLEVQQREYLETIRRSGEHLLALINDILDLSKIEAGQITLNKTNFNLYQLLNELQEMFRLRAAKKGINLAFNYLSELPSGLCTDRVKLRQVLINLLSNAIKFTTTGSVTVQVQTVVPTESLPPSDCCWLEFTVSDTGPGIAPHELSQLFQPFVQTTAGIAVGEGTGLGLTISRQYVQLMGGDITVTTELGVGTTFQFRLQAVPVEQILPQIQPQEPRVLRLAPNQPPCRILVVDDQVSNRELLVQWLQPVGFNVAQAANGREAILLYQEFAPHLIWMDMRMPILDGYEATQQIKSMPGGQDTVIIAITASVFVEQKADILAAGCDDFVAKPINESVIFAKIAQHLNVQYLYDQDFLNYGQYLNLCDSVLTLDSLQQLSPDFLQNLEDAILSLDPEQINLLLQEIQPQIPQLVSLLRTHFDNFEYRQILDAISSCRR